MTTHDPCPHCDGTGESPWDDATGRCVMCGGYGEIHPLWPADDDDE